MDGHRSISIGIHRRESVEKRTPLQDGRSGGTLFAMATTLLGSVAVGALAVAMIARRVHRTIARQALRPRQLLTRAVVLALVAVLLVIGSAGHGTALLASVAGIAVGAALGVFGTHHTVFETTAEGRFFTPPRRIGLAVVAIFLARLGYRFITMPSPVSGNAHALAMMQRSPLTLASAGLVLGYYLAFSVGVLRWNARTVT
jgi:hypothetical protein